MIDHATLRSAARFGLHCGRCRRTFDDGEAVYRSAYSILRNFEGKAPVCRACADPAPLDGWHLAEPCDGCGRPVHDNDFRKRRWTVCSQRCRQRIEARQRRERRTAPAVICASCEKPFVPRRADAKTCSSRCRQRLYRGELRLKTGGKLAPGSIRNEALANGIYASLPPGVAPDTDQVDILIKTTRCGSEHEREALAARLFALLDKDVSTGRRIFLGEEEAPQRTS